MVRGGANAADDAVRGAGAALSKTGDDVASIAGKELGAGAKAADDVAGVAGKELSAAEKAAASVEAQAAKRSGRLSGWIKANPKKAVALGLVSAAAIGAGTVAALGGEEETDPTNGPTNDPTNGPTTGPDDIAPKPSGGLTPKQQELIKQIKELMAKDYGGASTPEQQAWEAATSNAQAVVGKAEKANPAQIAQDKKNAAEAAAVTSAGEKKAEEKKGGGISASPAGTTTKPPGIKPGDLFKDRQGVNRDASGKEYKQNPATKQFEPVTESDNELARWLRIARG
jgi:hypothetical protein